MAAAKRTSPIMTRLTTLLPPVSRVAKVGKVDFFAGLGAAK